MKTQAWVMICTLALGACERGQAPQAEPPAADTPSVTSSEPVSSDEGKDAKEPTAATPAEPPGPPPEQQAAEALLADVEALGKLHDDNADDCGALAAAIETFHGERGASMAAADSKALAWIDQHDEARVRMRTAMNSVMTASMKCRKNAEFAAVQRKLFETDAP